MTNTPAWLNPLGGLGFTFAPLMVGVTLLSASVCPARANPLVGESIYINGVGQQHSAASWIYGSPIAAPTPVDPVTGLTHSSSTSYYGGYPVIRQRVSGGGVVDSTLVNPTVVNSTILNSTLINPTIIDSSGYSRPVIGVPTYPRTFFRGSFGISY